MKRSLLFGAAILAAAAGAAAFRLPQLTRRPMHGDEAVHAVKFQDLLEKGTYRYNPREYHGPSIYYLALGPYWLSGARSFAETTEVTFRVVPVVFGVGLVLLAWLLGDGLGRAAAVWAAALTAVSTAMVYYSRYYVQEMVFVFFTSALVAAGWRYARSGRARWAVAAGLCAGLMHASKETCIIAWGAMAVALACVMWWRKCTAAGPARARYTAAHLAAGAAAGVAVSVLLFSGLFTYARGPLDSVLTYPIYFSRAGAGGIHAHPWHFYAHLLGFFRSGGLWWSEGLILALAAVGLAAAAAGRGLGGGSVWFARFVAIYAAVSAVVYSAVPYKTPWSIMGTFHGVILLGGLGAACLVRLVRPAPLKVLVVLVLAGAAGHLGRQAYLASYRFGADWRNPYAYAHTSTDFLRLPIRIEQIAAVHGDGRNMVIKVISPEADFWPLPWYLRGFNEDHVGYYNGVPADPHAAVVVTSIDVADAVDKALGGGYVREHYELRPGGILLAAFIRKDLWREFMKTRTAVRYPGG